MRIFELLEQIQPMGSVSSTTGAPGQVPQVSQPSASTSTDDKDTKNPDQEKIAKLLMPQGITDPEDLNNATAALQVAMQNPKQLQPNQQELLGKLVNPLMKNQGFATALKQLSAQKPGQTTGQKPATPPGQTPPAQGTA
jgi:hypothetical protein